MASEQAADRADNRPDNTRPSKKVKFSPQVQVAEYHAVPAQETITFHLLFATTAEDLEREIAAGGMPFRCEFYNQVFGESEEINGYKGLQIDIWLALNSYHCWVDIKFEAKRPGADDVMTLLQAWWPRPFTTDRAQFISRITAAPALDFSQGLGTAVSSIQAGGYAVKLYHSKMVDTPGWFKELHARMEPLLIFTIDGANFLDVADPKWEVVAAVMERSGQQQLIGYMMLYNFYAWPLNQRPRVAQVLVLPPLQGGGFGKAMIKAAYDLAQQRDAVDLTFEDPAPGLQRLREKLELDLMRSQPWLVTAADTALAAAEAEELKQQTAAAVLYNSVLSPPQQQADAPAANGNLSNSGQQQVPAANGQQTHQQQQQQQQQRAEGAAAAAAGLPDQQEKPPKPPAALLAMPQDLQQRVTKELKIHKHQVATVWEALLFVQAPFGPPGKFNPDHPLQDPIQELVVSRLETAHAVTADKNAANKRLVQIVGKEDDWFVYKVPRDSAATEGASAAVMSDTVNVGRHTITEMSADEWSERLQQLAAERLEQLMQLRMRTLKK